MKDDDGGVDDALDALLQPLFPSLFPDRVLCGFAAMRSSSAVPS